MGADMISIKDMAGLITPTISGQLVRKLKEEVRVPIDFHTHCTPGFGLASVLMAIVNGVDIVDTSIWNFAGGPAAPAYELIQIFADRWGLTQVLTVKQSSRSTKNSRSSGKNWLILTLPPGPD
jgi:pyruvate/oxaloacetate carboxyltransferase